MQAPPFPDRVFTTSELPALGITRHRLDRAVAEGSVRHVVQGAYAPAHLPDTVALRATASQLVLADHHVVVDRSAAAIHGIDVLTWAEHDVPPPLESCALRERNPTHRDGIRGRSRDLLPRDIEVVHGVRTTTALRTALDLGCNLERKDAFAALCLFARAHGVTPADLTAELPRFAGRRGVVQLRALIPLVDPRFESVREAWTYLAVCDAGLPRPEPQHWVLIDGVPTYRLDLAYPRARVCVEYDGLEAHALTEEQRLHDARRRDWLRRNGWTVIVVRVGDFTGEALDRWLDELREALRSAYTNRRW